MPSRIPGIAAKQIHRKPKCARDPSHSVMRDTEGAWVCIDCANVWLEAHVEGKLSDKSVGGVELPAGVRDDRRVKPRFQDALPNRAARRRAKRR